MKSLLNRVTLMRYADDQDDGRIPLSALPGTALTAAVIWAAWVVACWIVKN